MRRLLLLSVASVLPFVVTPALAAPSVDSFSIYIGGIGVGLVGWLRRQKTL